MRFTLSGQVSGGHQAVLRTPGRAQYIRRSKRCVRAEWVAGQYRDILGIELELKPNEDNGL